MPPNEKKGFSWKGAVKPGRVPTAGLNEQSGLNCTERAPSKRGTGYRRTYGETTNHAPEASVFTPNPLGDRMGSRGHCYPIWSGCVFWTGGHARRAR